MCDYDTEREIAHHFYKAILDYWFFLSRLIDLLLLNKCIEAAAFYVLCTGFTCAILCRN